MDFRRVRHLIHKERIQILRDRRTLAMMVLVPALWLLLFGYAATFDVRSFQATLLDAGGGKATAVVDAFERRGFDFHRRARTQAAVTADLRSGASQAALLVLPGRGPGAAPRVAVWVDGSGVIAAEGALRAAQQATAGLARDTLAAGGGAGDMAVPSTRVLFNPDMRSANFMIPGLIGLVILLEGGMMTALGVVKERERGTLEQLAVTPLQPGELILGKLLPYAAISFADLLLVVGIGVFVFDVPFEGSFPLMLAISVFFVLGSLGVGLLISTASQNQQQAMQLAMFFLFPQILLSGLIFPLSATPWSVRWVSYLLPLTYFVPVARGFWVKGVSLGDVWVDAVVLVGYAGATMALASLRFRREAL